MSRYDRVERTFPWIIVAVFLAGALLVAAAIVTGSLLLGILGAVIVVAAVVGGVVLPRVGLSAPVSLGTNYPESAGQDDAGGPFGDAQDDEPYQTFPEVPARKLPKGPDRERAKPQHMNLGPHENVRQVNGETVIEVPEKERED